MGNLARHIQRLERMALPPTGGPRVIRLIDGHPAGDPLQASVGPHRLDQAAGTAGSLILTAPAETLALLGGPL